MCLCENSWWTIFSFSFTFDSFRRKYSHLLTISIRLRISIREDVNDEEKKKSPDWFLSFDYWHKQKVWEEKFSFSKFSSSYMKSEHGFQRMISIVAFLLFLFPKQNKKKITIKIHRMKSTALFQSSLFERKKKKNHRAEGQRKMWRISAERKVGHRVISSGNSVEHWQTLFLHEVYSILNEKKSNNEYSFPNIFTFILSTFFSIMNDILYVCSLISA